MLASMTMRLAVVDEGRGRRADARLLVLLEPLAEVEGELRAVAVRSDARRRGCAMSRPSPSRTTRSLRMVTVETPNRVARSLTRTRPCSLDEARDLVLALAGEDVAWRGAGRDGQTNVSSRTRFAGTEGFRVGCRRILVPKRSAMSRN